MPRLALFNPLRGPCPPDGYRWKDPLDGWESHAWDYPTWVEQAEKHFRCNDRAIPPDLGEQMQEQLCLTLPPGWCNYDDPARPRVTTQLDWNDVLRGASRFSDLLAGGVQLVDKAEAERRALICSRCYLNVQMSGCSGCQAAVQALSHLFPATKYDFALRSCAACHCNLRAKVHFPMEILDKETLQVQQLYPEHCWLRKGGSNYHG